MVVDRDALPQLAQALVLKRLCQLRLPHQDDLQQLVGFGLKVREQPHLLQGGGAKILGLVNHHHDGPAGLVLLEQIMVQGGQHLVPSGRSGAEPEFAQDPAQQLE